MIPARVGQSFLGATPEQQRVALSEQLSAIARAIALAQKGVAAGIPGQDVALRQLQEQYRKVAAQISVLQKQAAAQDIQEGKPTGFEASLDALAGAFKGIGIGAAVALGVAAYLALKR